jgi:hypothetical protein
MWDAAWLKGAGAAVDVRLDLAADLLSNALGSWTRARADPSPLEKNRVGIDGMGR